MMLTLGTSVVLSLSSATPAIAPAYRTLAAAEPGQDGAHAYTCESVVQSGTLILKWFVDEFGAGDDFSHWEKEASALPPGSEGLMTVPHFWCEKNARLRLLALACDVSGNEPAVLRLAGAAASPTIVRRSAARPSAGRICTARPISTAPCSRASASSSDAPPTPCLSVLTATRRCMSGVAVRSPICC